MSPVQQIVKNELRTFQSFSLCELFLQGLVAFLGLSKTTKAVSKLRKFKAAGDVGRGRGVLTGEAVRPTEDEITQC